MVNYHDAISELKHFIHSDGHVTINRTTKVTGKGQQYFINRFLGKAVEGETA